MRMSIGNKRLDAKPETPQEKGQYFKDLEFRTVNVSAESVQRYYRRLGPQSEYRENSQNYRVGITPKSRLRQLYIIDIYQRNVRIDSEYAIGCHAVLNRKYSHFAFRRRKAPKVTPNSPIIKTKPRNIFINVITA